MKDYLRLIDTHTCGPWCDVTPLSADPIAFAQLIADLSGPFASTAIDCVAGIDALGFILGTAVALHLNKGFIPIRKSGKLPVAVAVAEFVDYTGERKALELRRGILKPGDRVLVVDEWVETGARVQAAIDLIERERGVVAGVATINIDHCPITVRLCEKYRCQAIWSDMSLTEW
jgi:adenine phosphoribosyltransferase